jgi:hypothetical protein
MFKILAKISKKREFPAKITKIPPKTFFKIEKIEPPNPLSNPGLDVHKPRYRRIPKSPGKIVKIQKSRIAIGKRVFSEYF